MSKRRRPTKSKRNNNRARRPRVTMALKPFVAPQPSQQRTMRVGKIPRQRAGLSEPGVAFLKCAFASPDFAVDPGKGIPDQFHGRTLSIKDCQTTSIAFEAGMDTYVVVAPIPGYAYFIASVPVGDDPIEFVGVPFTTYATNFGNGTDVTNNFSKFRYASLAAGLYPTSNMMQFSGSIQCWRIDLNLAENLTNLSAVTGTNSIGGVVGKRVQGLQGVTTLAPRDNYSGSFINGAYTFAFDKTQDFEWCDFCSAEEFGVSYSHPATGPPVLTGKRMVQRDATTRLTGLGNTNTIVYKVSTPTGAINTSIMRIWNCIELQPDTNSALYQYSGSSPMHDPLALEAYSRMKMRFPVAVPAAENGKFWENVMRVFKEVTGIAMLLPGPIGVIGGGLNTAATAIHALF